MTASLLLRTDSPTPARAHVVRDFLDELANGPSFPGALCAESDPETWFPEKGGSTRQAKAICAACPARAACLQHALTHPDDGRFGIWGGLSERERRRLLDKVPQ